MTIKWKAAGPEDIFAEALGWHPMEINEEGKTTIYNYIILRGRKKIPQSCRKLLLTNLFLTQFCDHNGFAPRAAAPVTTTTLRQCNG